LDVKPTDNLSSALYPESLGTSQQDPLPVTFGMEDNYRTEHCFTLREKLTLLMGKLPLVTSKAPIVDQVFK
jgi:hypothetical protein